MTIKEELDNLKASIENLSDAAESCNIVKVSHYSELVGDSMRSLNYGRDLISSEPKEEKQVIEYQSSMRKYEEAKQKLFKCDCQKN